MIRGVYRWRLIGSRQKRLDKHSLKENADSETCYHNTVVLKLQRMCYVNCDHHMVPRARQNDSAGVPNASHSPPSWFHLVLSFPKKSKHQVTMQCLPYLQLTQPRKRRRRVIAQPKIARFVHLLIARWGCNIACSEHASSCEVDKMGEGKGDRGCVCERGGREGEGREG